MAERSTLFNEVHKDGKHAQDLRATTLFDLADKDHTGTIDRAEFDRLHKVIRDDTLEEVRQKEVAEAAAKSSKRRARVATLVGFVMGLFLLLSLTGNLIIISYVVDSQVTTRAGADGMLVSKSADEVQVAQSGREVMLGLLPFLPRAAPKEAMAIMPELVVVHDAAAAAPLFHALKVQKAEYQPPSTVRLLGAFGEVVTLTGASDATYTRADGTTFSFCSACSPVNIKSLPHSAAISTAIGNFTDALAAGPVSAACVTSVQSATALDSAGLADDAFMVMPDVCRAEHVLSERRRRLRERVGVVDGGPVTDGGPGGGGDGTNGGIAFMGLS